MSRKTDGTISEARRRSAKKHAERPHNCPVCKRVVFGNGYKNHFRACMLKARPDISKELDYSEIRAEYQRGAA